MASLIPSPSPFLSPSPSPTLGGKEKLKLDAWDFTALAFYFLAVFAVAVWASRISHSTSRSFFLAGKSIMWWAIGTSVFASNIGTEHFVGMAGSGVASGIAVSGYEWLAGGFICILLGMVFYPVYFASQISTVPQYLQIRFNSTRIRKHLTVLSLFLYIFAKVSTTLWAGGVVLRESLGLHILVSSACLIFATGAYTVAGGLSAVIYTEVLQSVVLLVGGFILLAISLVKVGGMGDLRNSPLLSDSHFDLFLPPDHENYPWPGMVFGALIPSLWYWCADQVIVQRLLSASSKDDGQGGAVFAAFLKLLTPFMFVLPGIIALVLYPEEVGDDPDSAYPLLVLELLPSGLRGLMIASMLAALMSSLASVFHSSSTLFTLDIWVPFRGEAASERELLLVGRSTTGVVTILSFLVLPVIENVSDQLFVYVQSITTYVAPPITVVFLLAMFWHRADERPVFWSLIVGLVLGMGRFIGEIIYGFLDIEVDERFWIISINYLYFGLILASVCAIISIGGSFLMFRFDGGKGIPDERSIQGYTFWTRHYYVSVENQEEKNEESTKDVSLEAPPPPLDENASLKTPSNSSSSSSTLSSPTFSSPSTVPELPSVPQISQDAFEIETIEQIGEPKTLEELAQSRLVNLYFFKVTFYQILVFSSVLYVVILILLYVYFN